MKYRSITIALAATLLLGSTLPLAAENNTDETDGAGGKPQATKKSSPAKHAEIAARRKAAAKVKRVDVNNASAEQLKQLPGITDVEATKIIAGRPYNSKTFLVTQNVISESVYQGITSLIAVGPPKKGADKKPAPPAKK
jgi:DNA uptake protein ComE-like DNA-binding protein